MRRRVAKLYLPPGEWRFGCRKCHDFIYESCHRRQGYDRYCRLIAAGAPEAEGKVRTVSCREAVELFRILS